MAKRKKKETKSDTRVAFLTEKGKEFAADLRKRATPWEKTFKLKLEQLKEAFVFQYPVICNRKTLYIIDFYFPQYKLAIELDGAGHYTPDGMKHDKIRTSCLKKEGIRVIRFMNRQVQDITAIHIKDLLKNYDTLSRPSR